MKRLITVVMCCAGFAQAQRIADVTSAIASAHRELIVVLPRLQRTDIAKAIKQAAAQGTRVFLIFPKANVKGGGYLLNVSHGPTSINTYLYQGSIAQPWIMVDGAWIVSGDGLESGSGEPLIVNHDPTSLTRLSAWAQHVTAAGPTDRVEIIRQRYSTTP